MVAEGLFVVIAFACVVVAQSSHFRHRNSAPQALTHSSNFKHILHFSDVHLKISESLDVAESAKIKFMYGEDAPITLLVSALKFAKTIIPDPDFFLYTGDHAVHGDLTDEFLAQTIDTNIKAINHYFVKAESDNILDVTAVIGNADTSPDYSMSVTDPEVETNPAITLISAAWQESLPEADFDWFNHRGYLMYDVDEKLVVLTLNTVPYSPKHTLDRITMKDPFNQFAWLEKSLLELRTASKFAYIVGHIPPIIDSFSGAQMWKAEHIQTYKSIVSQFADVVKAQFFAHVHSIEFRIPLVSEQQAQKEAGRSELVPMFMSAAISPMFDNNPAFIIWDFDVNTYEVLDFTVYGANIRVESQELNWKPLFKASTEYGIRSLRTSELNAFVDRATSDPALLEKYYYNSKAQSYRQPPCVDAACHSKWLCTTQWHTRSEDFQACVIEMRLLVV